MRFQGNVRYIFKVQSQALELLLILFYQALSSLRAILNNEIILRYVGGFKEEAKAFFLETKYPFRKLGVLILPGSFCFADAGSGVYCDNAP
jgi:hypothetical protein